jgi:hypothetical protein
MNKVRRVATLNSNLASRLDLSQRALVVEEDNNDISEKDDNDQVGFLDLFRFATKFDITLLIFGTICAGVMGAIQPMIIIFIGDVVNIFL